MATVLVTGGTGFVGSHIVRALRRRGDDVRVSVRERSRTDNLRSMDLEYVSCDLRDPDGAARAVAGVDKIVNAAGLVSLDPADNDRLFGANVTCTRNVLEAALAADVGRVVHVSAAAALGPAPESGTVDEDAVFNAGRLSIPYINSKHEAEIEAMRVAAQGLGVVVVSPTWAMGPGDVYASSTYFVRNFLRGEVPVYLSGGVNIVDVRDVARGVLLADRKGEVGERYVLGGRNFTASRLMADLSRISGVRPGIQLPGRAAVAAAQVARTVGVDSGLNLNEAKMASRWWTYRSAKAKRDIGFEARPHEETLEDTVSWWVQQLGDNAVAESSGPMAPLRMAGRAVGLAGRGVSLRPFSR
ncbi:MAG: SDR family NAD(P)-dependent oxidoreductase [Solirubrobacterales bacterium]